MAKVQAESDHPRGGGRYRLPPTAGLTLVEWITGAGILLLALMGFARVVVFASMHTAADQELEAVRTRAEQVLHDLRQASFSEVFALYNEDPFDDPAGTDTAPGPHIEVPGLRPAADGPPGPIGTVFFPTQFDFDAGLQLREDVLDPRLGMPRDLDGDGQVDHRDHASDYLVLPVRLRFAWVGAAGPSDLEIETLIVEY